MLEVDYRVVRKQSQIPNYGFDKREENTYYLHNKERDRRTIKIEG